MRRRQHDPQRYRRIRVERNIASTELRPQFLPSMCRWKKLWRARKNWKRLWTPRSVPWRTLLIAWRDLQILQPVAFETRIVKDQWWLNASGSWKSSMHRVERLPNLWVCEVESVLLKEEPWRDDDFEEVKVQRLTMASLFQSTVLDPCSCNSYAYWIKFPGRSNSLCSSIPVLQPNVIFLRPAGSELCTAPSTAL